MKEQRKKSTSFFYSILLCSVFSFFVSPFVYAEEGKSSPPLSLNIQSVISHAVEHNLDVLISRHDPGIAKEAVEVAASVFDPVLGLDVSTSESNNQNSSSFANPVVMNKQNRATLTAKKLFEYGTQGTLTLSSQRDSSTSSFVSLNPSYSSSVSLEVRQPLLKNRGTAVNRTPLIIAQKSENISRYTFSQKLIDTVTNAQDRYWKLYAAKEELAVQRKSLRLARKFLRESKLKVKVGTFAPIDTLAAEAEVASLEEQVIIAENDYLNKEEELISYIYGKSFHSVGVHLEDKPEYRKVSLSERELTSLAFQKRNDYLIAKENVERADVSLVFAENQRLPVVDLYATLSLNGLSGQEHQVTTSFAGGASPFIGNYDKSVGRVTSGDYYSAQIGISVEYPWNLRKDKALYRTAMHEKEKALNALLQVEQQIILDVRTGIRNVRANDKRYHSASIAEKLAEEKLLAEEKKFNVGLSTSYNVLQYQRDLTNASVKRIKAAIDYRNALIALDRLTGITLEKNNIDIVAATAQ